MRRNGIMQQLRIIIVAVGLILGMSLIVAPQASAATYGNVWVVTPKWAGYCPNPVNGYNNYVTGINWMNGGVSSGIETPGDDRIYPTVRRYEANRFTLAVSCRWSQPQSVSFTIYPTAGAYTYAPRADGGYIWVW